MSHQPLSQPLLSSSLPSQQLLVLKKRARARGLTYPPQGRSALGSLPRSGQRRPRPKLELAMGSWQSGLPGGTGWSGDPVVFLLGLLSWNPRPALPLLCISGEGRSRLRSPHPESAGFHPPSWERRVRKETAGLGLCPHLEQLWPSSGSGSRRRHGPRWLSIQVLSTPPSLSLLSCPGAAGRFSPRLALDPSNLCVTRHLQSIPSTVYLN